MKPNYILKKDLPDCPKGRVFKPTYDGKNYFLSMSTTEHIEGKLNPYKFEASTVENNPDWFKKETESDLKVQLDIAKKKKQDAEFDIKTLKKTLSKK